MLSTESVAARMKMKMKATTSNESSCGQPAERYTVGSPGREVPIAIPLQNGGFRFDKEELTRILLRSGVQNMPLVVISVAGAFRTGKSFLLNFLIRYLRNQGRDDWMGDADSPLEGFSWRGGCDRHTAGILVWSEVFRVTRPHGDQVAVLLMDTQGTFDCQTSFKDVTTIFALGALTSSILVYNISGNIREDDLQHLQYFIEYGRMAQNQQSDEKPFQKLMILVRDWGFVQSYSYGAKGGEAFVKERLKTSAEKREQKALRELLASCFEHIDCFLMPYPGKEVATGESVEGYLPSMDNTFKRHLQDFVASLLAGDKLVTKRINGQEISCGDWFTYFSKYGETLKGGQLPTPKSLIEMTAVANNEVALDKAKERYEDGMEKECGPDKPFINTWDLENLHKDHQKAALDFFANIPKMGGDGFSKPCEKILRKEIKRMKDRFFKNNKNKSCNATPVVLTVPMILSLGGAVAATVAGGPIGVGAAVVGLMVGGTSAGTLTAWCVSRVTGKISLFREKLDNAVDYAWMKVWRGKKKINAGFFTGTGVLECV
ncbi:atlastin-2-like [Haemaphysalis longicornis]